MSKQTRFARAFEPWIAEWSKLGLSGTQERVLLMLIMNMESDSRGEFSAWRPRREVADMLGLSERQVRKAVDALKAKGVIETVGKSHSGCCQRYRIMPRKGHPQRDPIQEKGSPERAKKGPLGGPKRGPLTGDPTRSVEGATTAPSTEGRSSARHEVDYERMDEERNRSIV